MAKRIQTAQNHVARSRGLESKSRSRFPIARSRLESGSSLTLNCTTRAREDHMRGRDFGQKLSDSQCAHLALANHTSALATSSRARDLCCAVATSARNTLTLRMHKSRSRLSHTRSRLEPENPLTLKCISRARDLECRARD
ncbi:hypothetical protein JCGZ_13665 [Jatropha curcas]|uniref:Uncharacterized protein n=1 Tax=Jatropha curcas TaxID=180498 RepID=A0A067K981_JATCU|nr:hypothetical protein JCGZ_13665 [Jatropha curcas]